MPVQLTTKQGEALLQNNETPWTIYPRPQMRRDSYVNLNGLWELTVGDVCQSIRVPFCPESLLSGVNQHFPEGSYLVYRRNFSLPADFNRGRVLLHIGAADQFTACFVNGSYVGEPYSGYTSVTFDITPFLCDGENTLTLSCHDDLGNQSIPYGKQVTPAKRGGMWYTPVSGIWQTVWLESVPETYIERLRIDNRGYAVTVSIEPKLSGKVTVPGLGTFPLVDGQVTIEPENPHLWSPEDPFLYPCSVETETDRVESYFAIRSLEIQNNRLCLNGKPYFFHGLLDQGYWPDGLFTPAAPECYAEDILAM